MRSIFILATLAIFATGFAQDQKSTTSEWRSFSGSWYATGTRQTVPTEGAKPAVVVRAAGNVVIEGGHDLSRGFRGDAAYFHDGAAVGVGRGVWIDESGDRIFIELSADAAKLGRIKGKVITGTGRYARLEGEFTMSWQFVVEGEDSTVQGRAADLRGKFRFTPAR